MPELMEHERPGIFVYGDHRFDDPGTEYTVEQIENHLGQYFPDLAHATTEEKALPDGTVEVTFHKQVARKGSGDDGNQTAMMAEPDNSAGAEGVRTSYAYDDLDRLSSVTENDTGGAQTDNSNLLTQ